MSHPSKIIFLSDIHLGIDHKSAFLNRKAVLIEKLQKWKTEISHLFLVGDIFEFWMEYRDYIPKSEFDFLACLKELVDHGVEVHYFSGNHDFNLGSFFDQQLGIYVYNEPKLMELQGRKVALLHGDGMLPSDKAYRVMKSVLVHPISNFLFKLIHPDWGMALARLVGSSSRATHQYGNVKWPEYEAAALSLMEEMGADVCIHGHVHETYQKELGDSKDKLYLNIGQWFHNPSWIEMEAGEFQICFLKDEMNS